jgi:hypothetical protein
MARFILHREKGSQPEKTPVNASLPEGLRADERVTIIDEMPRMLLVDCPEGVAAEWLAQMPGWKMQPETRASVPDPRPKLKKPGK